MSTSARSDDANFNWPPTDEELEQCFNWTEPGGEPPAQPVTLAEPPAPDGARQPEPVLAAVSRGEWPAQIAQLQALIEELTEGVEWRATTARTVRDGDSHA